MQGDLQDNHVLRAGKPLDIGRGYLFDLQTQAGAGGLDPGGKEEVIAHH